MVQLLLEDVVIVLADLQRFLVAAYGRIDFDDIQDQLQFRRPQALLPGLNGCLGGFQRRRQTTRRKQVLGGVDAQALGRTVGVKNRIVVGIVLLGSDVERRAELGARLDITFIGRALLRPGLLDAGVLRIGHGDGVAQGLGLSCRGQGQRSDRNTGGEHYTMDGIFRHL